MWQALHVHMKQHLVGMVLHGCCGAVHDCTEFLHHLLHQGEHEVAPWAGAALHVCHHVASSVSGHSMLWVAGRDRCMTAPVDGCVP
jgi:hypothetical protein